MVQEETLVQEEALEYWVCSGWGTPAYRWGRQGFQGGDGSGGGCQDPQTQWSVTCQRLVGPRVKAGAQVLPRGPLPVQGGSDGEPLWGERMMRAGTQLRCQFLSQ